VANAGAVAEGEAEFGLEPLLPGQLGGTRGVPVIVGDRFLAEDALALLQRRHRDLEVAAVGGAEVDGVEVGPGDERLPVVARLGDAEFGRGLAGALAVDVAEGHQFDARIALLTGEVRHTGPASGAEYAYAESSG